MKATIRRSIKVIPGLAFCLLLLAACSSPAPTPTPSPEPEPTLVHAMFEDTSYYGTATASVNERIYASDVVVRATLVTATKDVLTFNAIEYLKGSGPSRFTLPASAGRNTTWDNREALLFLTTSAGDGASGGASARPSAPTFQFTDTRVSPVIERREYKPDYDGYQGDLPDGNTMDSRNPVWVPSESSGGAGGRSADATGSASTGDFISHGNPSETLTLAELKAKIAWLEGGDGSASYRQCIIDALDHERVIRDSMAAYPGSYDFPVKVIEMVSGLPAGQLIDARAEDSVGYTDTYDKFWFEGPGKDFFTTRIVDDDDRPDTGWSFQIETARPIPGGTYRFDWYWQLDFHIPCNYVRINSPREYEAVVTSPPGTIYEALFDPVAIGAAVGADGTNGALEPTAFTVGGVSTALQSLKWQDGSVTLELSPAASLSSQDLDFIALDGSVSLSLDGGAATASGGTLTWTVASQPWQADDQLMLRIREAAATPTATPTPVPPAEVTPTPEPTLRPPDPLPEIQTYYEDPYGNVPYSLDRSVFSADVIVLASFQSATGDVQTVPSSDSGVAPTYRPMQTMRFRAAEYLKGTGPTEFIVEVLDDSWEYYSGGNRYNGYLTEAEAMTEANRLATERNAAWDATPTVVFINGSVKPASTGDSTATGTGGNARVGSRGFYFDTVGGRVWRQAQTDTGTRGEAGSTTPTPNSQGFITDSRDEVPRVVTLGSLRSKIAEMEATRRAGAGITGYDQCILVKLSNEDFRRVYPLDPGRREHPPIASGAAAGTEIFRNNVTPGTLIDVNFWVSGPDGEHFEASIVDNHSAYILTATRPLPTGTYSVRYNEQLAEDVPCNYKPTDAYSLEVATVTAPQGTLHEAFFDPVAIDAAVGADAANGALTPTAFMVGGVSTALQSLKWQDGSVTLELSPAVALSSQDLDFIALDGSVSLSLDDGAATASGGTLTWTVAAQPWQAGDHLMLRIREAGTTPTPTPTINAAPAFGSDTYSFSIAEDAAAGAAVGTLSATDPDVGDTVSYYITAGNAAGTFNIDLHVGDIILMKTLDYETTTSYTLTVEARDGNWGKDTASVTVTVVDVAE